MGLNLAISAYFQISNILIRNIIVTIYTISMKENCIFFLEISMMSISVGGIGGICCPAVSGIIHSRKERMEHANMPEY